VHESIERWRGREEQRRPEVKVKKAFEEDKGESKETI
jgi:hypothetical protein